MNEKLFCKDCKFFPSWNTDYHNAVCYAPMAPQSLVSGEPILSCENMREVRGLWLMPRCGYEGKWFKAKEGA